MTATRPGPAPSRWIQPTERMNTKRQLTVVDAIADLGGPERRPVSAKAVGRRLGVSADSVGGAQGFLIQSGLLEPGRGAWAVTETGLRLARLRSAADSARPRLLLRDHWRNAWFTVRARKALHDGPVEESTLAAHLRRGLVGRPERAVYLVEWLTYALIVHKDEEGRIHLAATGEAPPSGATADGNPRPVADPLFAGDIQDICALPQQDFLGLLGAYRAIFSLTPRTTRTD